MAIDIQDLAVGGVRRLQPYQPGKPIEELQRELGVGEIVKLASNENPRGPSPRVAQALAQAAGSINRYPDGSGYALKNALSDHLAVTPDQLTLGNGSNDVLDLIARTFLSSSHSAVVSQHAFVVYPLAVRAIGARLIETPARDYGHDLTAMSRAIEADTRLVFIANPNNPTGTWINRAELIEFMQAVPENVLVVLDEAYFEYVEDPDHPDGVALLAEYPNLIVTRTFSKAYGLAGLRVGYAVSSPAIADLLNRIREPFNVNNLALVCAAAALSDRQYVRDSRELNSEGMDQLCAGLASRGVGYIPSVANFVTVAMTDAAADYERMLRHGVIVRPIAVYQLPRHLRVSIGLAQENARFLSALDALTSG